ncbi:MAG: ATP-binding protein, partial [Desulfobacterales bacterium]|nr:ATP-binding protein [Desulfobacterales bacterium]
MTDTETRQKETNRGWVETITLRPPSLEDNTADADRLIEELKSRLKTRRVEMDLDLMRRLPTLIREWDYHVRCILFNNRGHWGLIDITSGRAATPAAGLAVDLGTTRVVLRLLDLTNNQVLAESSFDNPQIEVGPDILARIHATDAPGGLERLNQLILNGLNQAIDDLCRSKGLWPECIHFMTVAGNTTMTHLIMGLNPRWIIREPYIPVVNRPGLQKGAELGLRLHPRARVLIFPNIGSYFGGDLIAGILYSEMHRGEELSILVDVGTNAEVVLGNRHWLIGCAGAAGPALEGGVTRMGMTAGPGVIDEVRIDPDTLEFRVRTIDDPPPRGICGSGLIDLAAQLFLAGMLDIRGRFTPDRCGNRLKEIDGLLHLVVVRAEEAAGEEDLTISQADLDSLVRSKAAMYTILETLTMSVDVSLEDLD